MPLRKLKEHVAYYKVCVERASTSIRWLSGPLSKSLGTEPFCLESVRSWWQQTIKVYNRAKTWTRYSLSRYCSRCMLRRFAFVLKCRPSSPATKKTFVSMNGDSPKIAWSLSLLVPLIEIHAFGTRTTGNFLSANSGLIDFSPIQTRLKKTQGKTLPMVVTSERKHLTPLPNVRSPNS